MNRKLRRAELIAALPFDGRSTPGGDPPYVIVIGGGMDTSHVVRGTVLARFTIRCVAGFFDDAASVEQLDEMVSTVVTRLRDDADLSDYQLGEVGRDGLRNYQGADFLTADVECAAYITLDL